MKKYILLLLLGITITVNAQVCLVVPKILQEQSEWCWAAASKCVLDYYGFVHQQCEIAEYVRLNGIFNNLGLVNCCVDPLQGCNQGTSTTGGTGSIEDILVEFGNIANAPAKTLDMSGIEFHLNLQRPLIIRWENISDTTHGHAMVIYGTNGNDIIEFMDPDCGYDELPYNDLLNSGGFQWTLTIYPLVSPYIIPKHCSNCKFEPELGEEEMDCGGSCPPCEHAPQYKSFTTSTNNLPTVVRAIEKITAGNASVKVLTGQNVNFYTAGTIELLPGFEVEEGGNFTAEPKWNILEVTADCNKYCEPRIPTAYDRWCPWPWPYTNGTFLVEVANVLKIYLVVYRRYDSSWVIDEVGEFVYSNLVENQEGFVPLWDLIEGEPPEYLKPDYRIYKYWAYLRIYPCEWEGNRYWNYWRKFIIVNDPTPHKMIKDGLSDELVSINQILHTDIDNVMYPELNMTPSFSLIPNPNSGTFQLETNFPLTDISHLKIINLLGVPVYETKNQTSNTVQLQNAASGIFFVVIILKDGAVLSQKMVVQR
ncbi:MAG: T9SS type A sorting domain-containing protein [Bacteroidales bacterium]|jgi:hypothetical protein|nr:T9SS type A sorting domain-containing protein [Bacteroidales bacterium]